MRMAAFLDRARAMLVPTCLLPACLLCGCQRHPQTVQPDHTAYMVGPAWHAGADWYYPRASFDTHATGVATIAAYTPGQSLADGTRFTPGMLTGGHQTLQLPAVLRITNLANGRQIELRIDDRGPPHPGRILAVSPRTAALLGADGPFPVAIDEDTPYSQALAQRYGAAPDLRIATAPLGTVSVTALPPPGTPAPPSAPIPTASTTTDPDAGGPPGPNPTGTYPDRPAATITRTPARPVLYLIDAGSFNDRAFATSFAARIGGRFVSSGGRHPGYEVLAGPFESLAEADSALDLARRSGLTAARLTVQ